MRTNYQSDLPMESTVGYSRAVQVGDTLYTSATAPVDAELKVIGADTYTQAKYVFGELGKILSKAGFSYSDVVQVRCYLTQSADSAGAVRAFSEIFGEIAPTISMLHVQPFQLEELHLEIELTAVRA